MKVVTKIVMANDDDIEDVIFSDENLKIVQDDDYWLVVNIATGEEVSRSISKSTAEDDLLECAVDPMLPISGYGIYSGRKFWNMIDDMQKEVYKLAGSN